MPSSFNLATAITFTSPAAASTVVQTGTWDDLEEYDWFTLIGILTGATGGTLDVYLQSEIKSDVWVDWVHFPQKAAASAETRTAIDCRMSESAMATTGGGSTAAPGVALAASKVAFSHPGGKVRVVTVAGVGTSAGAAQTLYLLRWRQR